MNTSQDIDEQLRETARQLRRAWSAQEALGRLSVARGFTVVFGVIGLLVAFGVAKESSIGEGTVIAVGVLLASSIIVAVLRYMTWRVESSS
jgi:membrane protein YdbS with pleckstrin-like domain